MGKFILIDVKGREERRKLNKMVPQYVKRFEKMIREYQHDGTPTEEECKAWEDETIESLLKEFDSVAHVELPRMAKKETPAKRAQLVKYLEWKRSKLFARFSDDVAALKDQAASVMKEVMSLLKDEEAEIKSMLPVAESTITKEYAELMTEIEEHVESNFPDGVKGLDAYDDVLPDGIPAYADFTKMVKEHEAAMKEENTKLIPAEVEKIKASSDVRFKAEINEAIEAAVKAIEADLSDDTLPFLDEPDMAALRKELIDSLTSYGESRLDK